MLDHTVSLVTFIPLFGAIVIAFLPRHRPDLVRWTALGAALLAWVFSLFLLIGFTPTHPGFQFVEVADWIPAFGIQYKLGVDGLSVVLVVLTTTLTWISILASFGPIRERLKEYMISFLILEVGMLGCFVALDLFLFYIFFETVLVPMYLIIGIWGGANRIYATIKFVLYTLVGSLVPLFPEAAHTYGPAIIVLSLIAIIYGAIVSLVQPDLKRLIAFSSVSHMGFVTLGIFIFQEQGLQGAILQMVNHGLITGALFLLVGVIYERTHDRAIAKVGGLSAQTPVYAAAFGFFAFASAGLPGLSGFVGEFLVFVGSFAYSPVVAAIAALVMVLGAAYLLWMFQRLFTGELSDFLRGLGHHLTDANPLELLTLVPLGTLVVVFGLFPGLVLDLVSGTVHSVLASVGGATAALPLGR